MLKGLNSVVCCGALMLYQTTSTSNPKVILNGTTAERRETQKRSAQRAKYVYFFYFFAFVFDVHVFIIRRLNVPSSFICIVRHKSMFVRISTCQTSVCVYAFRYVECTFSRLYSIYWDQSTPRHRIHSLES